MNEERLTDRDLDAIERAVTPAPGRAPVAFGPTTVRRLLAEVRASRELLVKLEWAGMVDDYYNHDGYCPICLQLGPEATEHKPGCALARILGRT